MIPKKKLMIRKETLQEVTGPELKSVWGGSNVSNTCCNNPDPVPISCCAC